MSGRLTWVPFAPEHLHAFSPAPVFEADGCASADLAEHARASLVAGPAWSVCMDGRPVGCGGVVLLWRGVGEAWSLSAPGLGGSALVLHRIVAQRLRAAEREHGLHRIQTSVQIDNRQGRRWVAALGFREEGIMRGYGPLGDDFLRLARGRATWPTI